MRKKYYYIFQTEAGWIGVEGSSQGVCRTSLPKGSHEDALKAFDPGNTYQEGTKDYFSSLVRDFTNYFRGLPVEFKVQLDFEGLTSFEKAVYQATMTIPYGETRSYGWIAARTGKPGAARAAGQALGRNPLPILVPCHRVLAANGTIGGFSGGLSLKEYLLKLEQKR